MASTLSLPGDDEEIRNRTDAAIQAGTITDEQVAEIHRLLDVHPGRYTWEQIAAETRRS